MCGPSLGICHTLLHPPRPLAHQVIAKKSSRDLALVMACVWEGVHSGACACAKRGVGVVCVGGWRGCGVCVWGDDSPRPSGSPGRICCLAAKGDWSAVTGSAARRQARSKAFIMSRCPTNTASPLLLNLRGVRREGGRVALGWGGCCNGPSLSHPAVSHPAPSSPGRPSPQLPALNTHSAPLTASANHDRPDDAIEGDQRGNLLDGRYLSLQRD